jgi:hypothetical protein
MEGVGLRYIHPVNPGPAVGNQPVDVIHYSNCLLFKRRRPAVWIRARDELDDLCGHLTTRNVCGIEIERLQERRLCVVHALNVTKALVYLVQKDQCLPHHLFGFGVERVNYRRCEPPGSPLER